MSYRPSRRSDVLPMLPVLLLLAVLAWAAHRDAPPPPGADPASRSATAPETATGADPVPPPGRTVWAVAGDEAEGTEYLVNRNSHQVHTVDCGHLPAPHNRIPLGRHPDCRSAVDKARTRFPDADGCYHCSRPCHE